MRSARSLCSHATRASKPGSRSHATCASAVSVVESIAERCDGVLRFRWYDDVGEHEPPARPERGHNPPKQRLLRRRLQVVHGEGRHGEVERPRRQLVVETGHGSTILATCPSRRSPS